MPGSTVHRISQAGILEWVASSSSRGSSQPRNQTHIYRVFYTESGLLPMSLWRSQVLVRNMFCIISQSFSWDEAPGTLQSSWLNCLLFVAHLLFSLLFPLGPYWDAQHTPNKLSHSNACLRVFFWNIQNWNKHYTSLEQQQLWGPCI